MAEIDVYAAFVDVMGFSSQVEHLSPDDHSIVERCLRLSVDEMDAPFAVRRLCRQYKRFHKIVTGHFGDMSGQSEALITFSDSAYAIARDFFYVKRFAQETMLECLEAEIPIRIGIGRGTFARLSFTTSHAPSGTLVANAPFLGTAVVRAYRAAESTSCAGFRVLVHPSAAEKGLDLCDLIEPERSPTCVQELNVLYDPIMLPRVSIKAVFKKLDAMRETVREERAFRHYDATAAALMRQYEEGSKRLNEWMNIFKF